MVFPPASAALQSVGSARDHLDGAVPNSQSAEAAAVPSSTVAGAQALSTYGAGRGATARRPHSQKRRKHGQTSAKSMSRKGTAGVIMDAAQVALNV